jgi:hypothetical protein
VVRCLPHPSDDPGPSWATLDDKDTAVWFFTETRPIDARSADIFDTVMVWLDIHRLPASDLEVDALAQKVAETPNGVSMELADAAMVVLGLLYPSVQKRLDYLVTLTSAPDKRRPFHPDNEYEFQPDPDNERAAFEYGLNRLYDDAVRKARHDANPTPWHIMLRIMDEAATAKLTGGYNVHGSNLCPTCSTFRSTNGDCLCMTDSHSPRFHQITE